MRPVPCARRPRLLHEADRRFSTYRADSEIRRLDRGELRLADASPDVRWVLERCAALRRETGGFFDVRAAGRLDPSALVKGWAAQRAADILTAGGVTDFCLERRRRRRRSRRRAARARLARRDPASARPATRSPRASHARDLAVATSGAYERGAHIVDPRTGTPPGGVLSVTVTGPDLGIADAYSTAAFAMGADGPAWTLGLAGYEAMTILADGTVLCTPGFPLRRGPAREPAACGRGCATEPHAPVARRAAPIPRRRPRAVRAVGCPRARGRWVVDVARRRSPASGSASRSRSGVSAESAGSLRADGGIATALGRLAGLAAAYAMVVVVVLVARFGPLERAVGQDRLVRWHRRLGPWPLYLLCAHGGADHGRLRAGRARRRAAPVRAAAVDLPGHPRRDGRASRC